ncbi:ATP-binding cassette domain-containing protein [Paenibacillus turpanensis]|uniref:ATP-binding cassette domain-containing protein n=1 Tax=Paenibacillus turpanensis TaxID=2689078 RepID=UPI003132BF3D
MANTIAIEVNQFTKVIRNQTVLSDITMQFEAGKIYGIIGHNGSGKTMLFRAISGFIKPTKGEVRVWKKKIGENSAFPESVGILIESPGFLPHKTGFENLSYLANINHIVNEQQIKETIRQVGLDADDRKKVRNYSLGMRQRLGIAQAIMENPKILILDEPMNALDKDGVQLIKQILLEKRNEGCTILLASHNDADIQTLCDHVYILQNGRLQEEH